MHDRTWVLDASLLRMVRRGPNDASVPISEDLLRHGHARRDAGAGRTVI